MKLQRILDRISNLGPLAKAVLVVAGYFAAFMLASLAYDIRVAHEDPADVQASGGMYAFGDGMYFLFVFSLGAAVPTGLWLWFLRKARPVWSFLTTCALLLAATAVASLALYFIGNWLKLPQESALELWAALAVLRLLFTPILGGAFFVCLLLAPDRSTRARFFVAMAAEGICGAIIATHWFAPFVNGPAGP
jgi:hypothetical protein